MEALQGGIPGSVLQQGSLPQGETLVPRCGLQRGLGASAQGCSSGGLKYQHQLAVAAPLSFEVFRD